jgi:AmiR/NasT family two-component response regulator
MTAARAELIPDPDIGHSPVPSHPSPGSPVAAPRTERATVTDMTGRIADRQIVEAAKRLLMSTSHLTEPEAHRWIQKTAMDRRASKKAIAIGIIEALSEKI